MAFIVFLTVVVYYFIYKYRLNKRIKSGYISGRKFVDFPKIVSWILIAGLTVYSMILMFNMRYVNNSIAVSRNYYAIIDASDSDNMSYISYLGSDNLNDASFAKIYSKERNEGYNRKVIKDGDFIFIVFTTSIAPDKLHPDFLCFMEYIGEPCENMITYIEVSFASVSDSKSRFTTGGSFDELNDKCLLFMGNLEEECYIEIKIGFTNSEKDIFSESEKTAKVIITNN